MQDAACRGSTALFFPERGDYRCVTMARRICDNCPVWWECLQWAMTPDAPIDGIIAGLTQRERQQLRRDTRPARLGPVPSRTRSGTRRTPMPWVNGIHDPPPTTWTRTELLEARR